MVLKNVRRNVHNGNSSYHQVIVKSLPLKAKDMTLAASDGYVRCQADRYLDDGDLKVSTAYSLNKKGRWKLTELLASELNDDMDYVTTICHNQSPKGSKVKIFSTKSTLSEAVDIPQTFLQHPCLSRRKDHRKVPDQMQSLQPYKTPVSAGPKSDITYHIYARFTPPAPHCPTVFSKFMYPECQATDERKPRKSKHSQNALKFALEDFEDGVRDATFDLWDQPEQDRSGNDRDIEYVHIDNEEEQKTHHDKELDLEVIGEEATDYDGCSPTQRNGSMLSDWLKVKNNKSKKVKRGAENWELMEPQQQQQQKHDEVAEVIEVEEEETAHYHLIEPKTVEEAGKDDAGVDGVDNVGGEDDEDEDGDWQLVDYNNYAT